MDIAEGELDRVRSAIRELAKPLFENAETTALPPLREINHDIPLIEEDKVIPWRPSRCPEALRPQWQEKRTCI